MAGLLPHQLAAGGLTPEEVAADPYMREDNPILRLLVAYFQQTEGVQPRGRRSREKEPAHPTMHGNRMRETEGPIRAETARKAATARDRVLRQIP
jgi:hypothetical protein